MKSSHLNFETSDSSICSLKQIPACTKKHNTINKPHRRTKVLLYTCMCKKKKFVLSSQFIECKVTCTALRNYRMKQTKGLLYFSPLLLNTNFALLWNWIFDPHAANHFVSHSYPPAPSTTPSAPFFPSPTNFGMLFHINACVCINILY